MKKFLLLASTLSLLATPLLPASECFAQTAVATTGDTIVVDQSKPFVAKDEKQQRFMDYIDLQPGQESLPLSITFTNGGDSGAEFKWLRVSIAGRPYLTEADFKNNKTMSVDLSGKLGAGSSQIVILGAGNQGATLSWTVTAPKPVVTSAKPAEPNVGENITISGANFIPKSGATVVTLGETKAQIVSTTPTNIVCTVPDTLKPGDTPVNVTVLGIKGKSLTIKVKGRKPAELSEIVGSGFSWTGDLRSAPPGTQLTLRGKEFGDKKAKVKVLFGDVEAPVISRTDTEIVTSIPMGLEGNDPTWNVPISVSVDNVRSKNFLYINVQSRVW
jgi:hypothetical protein